MVDLSIVFCIPLGSCSAIQWLILIHKGSRGHWLSLGKKHEAIPLMVIYGRYSQTFYGNIDGDLCNQIHLVNPIMNQNWVWSFAHDLSLKTPPWLGDLFTEKIVHPTKPREPGVGSLTKIADDDHPMRDSHSYHLVMTNSSPWYRWPIYRFYRWFTY